MRRVRFAPSPTGSLHVGNALSAVANRALGDRLLLRIDDTDPARNVPGGEQAIEDDLRWLGVEWDEGPVRQSARADRQLEAWRTAGLPERFRDVMYLNPLTYFVEQTRDLLVWQRGMHWWPWCKVMALSMLLAALGFAWFQKTRKGFADVL